MESKKAGQMERTSQRERDQLREGDWGRERDGKETEGKRVRKTDRGQTKSEGYRERY